MGDTSRERPPGGGLLTTAEFVAAVNLRRPNGTKPLTVRTCLRCIAAGDIERYRPGQRRYKIPEREVERFTRDYSWRPD